MTSGGADRRFSFGNPRACVAPILNIVPAASIAPYRRYSMSAVTVRTCVLSRLPALVLLLLMALLLAATGSATPGPFEAAMHVAEGARNDAGLEDALVEPLASPVVETRLAVAFLETPRIVTKARTQTYEELRL